MADDSELTLKEKGGGKKKLILIAVAALVLIGGGVGAWLMLSGSAKPSAEETAKAEAAQAEPQRQNALYVGMPRPFVFNVSGQERDRLVQIKVQLMVRGGASEALAKQHIPLIEGTLLRVFSAASAEQLMTFEGKEKLRSDALAETQRVLKELTKENVVEQVLFTGFVMQ